MALNFQILSFKTRDSLHLKLTGDFDGSSAYELIHTLTEHGKDFYEIFIDTNELKNIHPYGTEVLQKRLDGIKKHFHGIKFFGINEAIFGTDYIQNFRDDFSGARVSHTSVIRIRTY